MADRTAAEQLAAIDTVAELLGDTPSTVGMQRALERLAARVTERQLHDREIGAAFATRRPDTATHEEWGALIRAAVEATGATITEPPRAVEAADEITEEADRG